MDSWSLTCVASVFAVYWRPEPRERAFLTPRDFNSTRSNLSASSFRVTDFGTMP